MSVYLVKPVCINGVLDETQIAVRNLERLILANAGDVGPVTRHRLDRLIVRLQEVRAATAVAEERRASAEGEAGERRRRAG